MIVVTGASGYLGSHITRRLAQQGKQVRALVFNAERAKREGRLQGLGIEWASGDVTNPDDLERAFQSASAIIHTVAIAIEKGGKSYERINYQGTVNAVGAAVKCEVPRFINISQLGADSRLPYRFLASKGKAQEYVAASSLKWTAFRPSVIWGPEDEFANTFARLVPFSPLIFPIIGTKETKFQPVWVEDVATCVVAALEDPETIGQEFELGGPEILTLEEIERRTLEAVGARRWMVRLPMPLIRLVVMFMERFLPNPPVTRSLLELLQVSNVTRQNAIHRFVEQPRPFSVEHIAAYMRLFRPKQTIQQFFGR